MNYYKNTEIAELLNISNTSVTRWIDAAIEGKNGLKVAKSGNKYRVLKTSENEIELRRLKDEGQKYRAYTTHKISQVSNKLLKSFSDAQLIEIVNTIKTKKQIPLKFAYTNQGGEKWNDFTRHEVHNQKEEKVSFNELEELMESTCDYLVNRAKRFDKVNVINIGQGNMKGLKSIMKSLMKSGKLKSFVSIDISNNLLENTKKDIEKDFPDLSGEYHLADVENQNIEEIVYKSKKEIGEVNFIFFLGSTYGSLMNRIRVLENLRSSLDSEDLLMISNLKQKSSTITKLDHLLTNTKFLDSILWIPSLLGIDVELSELKGRYSHTSNIREIELKLDKDYTLGINISNSNRRLEFYKGEGIVVWKHQTSNINNFLAELEIAELQSVAYLSDPKDVYLLNICKVRDI
jgi:uncharacterized SAM-dependent methyltransferase/biotin operon repressor